MANQPESILTKQLIPIENLDGATTAALEKLRKSPDFHEYNKLVSKLRKSAMECQHPECDAAHFQVTRKNSNVTIEWMIRLSENYHGVIDVTGYINEIGHSPDSSGLQAGIIVDTKGDGKVSIELEEGGVYLFHFIFNNLSMRDDTKRSYQNILFQVGIPLSDERRAFFRRGAKIAGTPADQLREEFEKLVDKKAAYYEMRKHALERIKAMNLSPEDEQREINDFNDEAERIKDNFGM